MYIGTSINNSATIEAKASAAVGEFLAVKFDSGKIKVCSSAGENALGLAIPGQEVANNGDSITVQVKDMGLWKTGAAVSAGAELTTDASGKAITATSGAFILAIALEDAAAADAVIKVQIVKAGYKSGGSVAPLTFAGLTDVDLDDLKNGEVIVYNSTTDKFENKGLALNDLADVTITSATNGDGLEYNDTNKVWENKQ